MFEKSSSLQYFAIMLEPAPTTTRVIIPPIIPPGPNNASAAVMAVAAPANPVVDITIRYISLDLKLSLGSIIEFIFLCSFRKNCVRLWSTEGLLFQQKP